MSTQTYFDDGAPLLRTHIPERHRVDGLQYGAHVSGSGWTGYYVWLNDDGPRGIARLTPADDELPEPDEDETQDEAIVRAISEELDA